MEKLNIRILTPIVAAILVAFSSEALAGQGFRFNSKQPVVQQKRMKAYAFGYGGLDFGAGYETTGRFDYIATEIPIDFDLKNGWTAGGGLGVYSGLLGGSRFEVEGSYTANDVGYLTYTGFQLPADFEMTTAAVMFNILKEIPLGQDGAVGYFGGGVGFAETEMNGNIDTIQYSDSSGGFAWQLIAGVDFPVTERLAIFMQYRYMVLSDRDFTTDFGDFTFVTDEKPYSSAVMVGARVSF